jgi:hypothetical protein
MTVGEARRAGQSHEGKHPLNHGITMMSTPGVMANQKTQARSEINESWELERALFSTI